MEEPNGDVPQQDLERAIGFAKRFAFGGNLFVYRRAGTWYLQRELAQPVRLNDPLLTLRVRSFGPFRSFAVKVASHRSLHVETLVLAAFARSADPTYDGIDEELNDFAEWLRQRAAEAGATWEHL